jgi:hypothetical protein
MKKSFIISIIDKPGSVKRAKADFIKNQIIIPALESYEVERADDIGDYREITDKIFNAIKDAKIIIADVSGKNENVWYELGIAHSLRKPVIHLMKRGTKIPFDVKNTPFIIYDITKRQNAINGIKKQLLSIEKNKKIINPFIKALSLENCNEHLKLFEKILGIKRVKYIDTFEDYCAEGIRMLNNNPSKYGILTVNTPVNTNESKKAKSKFRNYIKCSIRKVIEKGFVYKRLFILNKKSKIDIIEKDIKDFIDFVYKYNNGLEDSNIILGFVNELDWILYKNIDFYFTSDFHFSIAFLSLSNPGSFGESIHCYDVDKKVSEDLLKEIDSMWSSNFVKKYHIRTSLNKNIILKDIIKIMKIVSRKSASLKPLKN